MTANTVFKKTIFFSLLGHLTVFSIFSFTFGNRIPPADYATVNFFGAVLRTCELISPQRLNVGSIRKAFLRKPDTSALERLNSGRPLILNHYVKPQVNLALNTDKLIFVQKTTPFLLAEGKKGQSIMFYPILPQNFLLYFKDRQAVHIELMFNIIASGEKNTIAIKRKISSGNLEADLFTMRYIGHYLFIQQANFSQNNWQAVKIDLSTR